jgi:hypothetical protein
VQLLRTQFVRNWQMRSAVLLLIVSFLLPFAQMASSASGNPEASLPACCRAHGKHHCALHAALDGVRTETQTTLRTDEVNEKCPCGLCSASTTSVPHCSLPDEGISVSADCPSTRLQRALALERSQFRSKSNQKRGPPDSSI